LRNEIYVDPLRGKNVLDHNLPTVIRGGLPKSDILSRESRDEIFALKYKLTFMAMVLTDVSVDEVRVAKASHVKGKKKLERRFVGIVSSDGSRGGVCICYSVWLPFIGAQIQSKSINSISLSCQYIFCPVCRRIRV
jgi:hypothetical protein